MVAAFGHRPTESHGVEGGTKVVHLHAAVVDVELAGDLGSGSSENPAEGVSDRRPTGVAEVQRPGRVGRDELEVHPLAVQGVGVSVLGAGLDDRASELTLGRGVEGDVEEARAGDVDAGNPGQLREPGRDQLRDVARRSPSRLRELKRDVGRVIAVLLVLRALDNDGLRRLDRELSVGHRGPHRGDDGLREFGGSHAREVIATPHLGVRIVSRAGRRRRATEGYQGLPRATPCRALPRALRRAAPSRPARERSAPALRDRKAW